LDKSVVESVECSTEAEVQEYLNSFGLQLGECTVDDITIPYEFDDVYKGYNNIQKAQGFDLAEYKGKTLREGGILADIAPTLLDMMGLEIPKEMTGKSLIVK
jgi:hypothetical protein